MAPRVIFNRKLCALRSGSGPAELIIVQLGWMLATVQFPPPPPGPAAYWMKHEEKLDGGLNVGALTCAIDMGGLWSARGLRKTVKKRPKELSMH